MISFPNSKINIGLNILKKREDNFHDIESLFYPIPLSDVLEFVETSENTSIINTGFAIDAPMEKNLVFKAYQIFKNEFKLPNLKIALHKKIPFGAGLGGGSADAAFMLKMLNSEYNLQLSNAELIDYAAQLGSDCAFFISNQASLATGRGEILSPISLNLIGKWILIVKPPIGVSTIEAYSTVKPAIPVKPISFYINQPIETWQENIKNDFEISIFPKYPIISQIKNKILKLGAIYASMSGSGSSVFGIFKEKIEIESIKKEYKDCFLWFGKF